MKGKLEIKSLFSWTRDLKHYIKLLIDCKFSAKIDHLIYHEKNSD